MLLVHPFRKSVWFSRYEKAGGVQGRTEASVCLCIGAERL